MMTEILHFANENPVLTFFLVALFCQTIICVAYYIAYAIRGDSNVEKDDENE